MEGLLDAVNCLRLCIYRLVHAVCHSLGTGETEVWDERKRDGLGTAKKAIEEWQGLQHKWCRQCTYLKAIKVSSIAC